MLDQPPVHPMRGRPLAHPAVHAVQDRTPVHVAVQIFMAKFPQAFTTIHDHLQPFRLHGAARARALRAACRVASACLPLRHEPLSLCSA